MKNSVRFLACSFAILTTACGGEFTITTGDEDVSMTGGSDMFSGSSDLGGSEDARASEDAAVVDMGSAVDMNVGDMQTAGDMLSGDLGSSSDFGDNSDASMLDASGDDMSNDMSTMMDMASDMNSEPDMAADMSTTVDMAPDMNSEPDMAADMSTTVDMAPDMNSGPDMAPDMTTSCTYTPTPATNPEPSSVAGITADHNEWRWRAGTAPLAWNTTMGSQSQTWADNCQFTHSTNAARQMGSGFSSVGENIYWSSGSLTNQRVLNSVSNWASERVDYDYGTAINSTNYQVFGHYTQIVWKNSTDLGCGATYCPNLFGGGTLVVCRYGPAGNFIGQTPYDYTSDSCVDLDNDDTWQFEDADDTDRTIQ